MFNGRLKILLLVAAVACSGLIIRLVKLQLVKGVEYRARIEAGHQIELRPIRAKRGRILARGPGGKGPAVVLVANEAAFELGIVYPVIDRNVRQNDPRWIRHERRRLQRSLKQQKVDPDLLIRKLEEQISEFWETMSAVTGMSAEELEKRKARITRHVQRRREAVKKSLGQGRLDYPILEQRMFYPIMTDLDESTKLELDLALAGQRWAKIMPSARRVYRRGQTLCHILGRTYRKPGAVPKTFEALDEDYLPGELRGSSGLEAIYEPILRGRRGWVSLGDQPEISEEPIDGHDVVLTIDIALQEYAAATLREKLGSDEFTYKYATGGSVVVIDLTDQSLLALVSVPTYDPSARFSQEAYNKLRDDYRHEPLTHRALMAQYPPGSIIKPIVAQIALACGAIGQNTHFECTGRWPVTSKYFKCWKTSGHGPLGLVEGIARSCDVYFYHVGQAIGGKDLAEYYRLFGLGAKPGGLKLPRRSGRVPSGDMGAGDARNLAIGQGKLEITPLQAAIMVSTLLSGEVRDVRLAECDPPSEGRPTGLGMTGLGQIRDGMEWVINREGGTGYKYARDERIYLAGKSGSAQAWQQVRYKVSYIDSSGEEHVEVVRSMRNRGRFIAKLKASDPAVRIVSTERLVWPVFAEEDRLTRTGRARGHAHAWFVGYAPADRPRVAIAVMVEYGQSGGPACGGIFRDIAVKCHELGYF